MKTSEIRSRFIDFFADRDHTIVPNASLLYNDPTLLFVNAGMVLFKTATAIWKWRSIRATPPRAFPANRAIRSTCSSKRERELQRAGELRKKSNFGKGQMVSADYTVTPTLIFNSNNLEGFMDGHRSLGRCRFRRRFRRCFRLLAGVFSPGFGPQLSQAQGICGWNACFCSLIDNRMS